MNAQVLIKPWGMTSNHHFLTKALFTCLYVLCVNDEKGFLYIVELVVYEALKALLQISLGYSSSI